MYKVEYSKHLAGPRQGRAKPSKRKACASKPEHGGWVLARGEKGNAMPKVGQEKAVLAVARAATNMAARLRAERRPTTARQATQATQAILLNHKL